MGVFSALAPTSLGSDLRMKSARIVISAGLFSAELNLRRESTQDSAMFAFFLNEHCEIRVNWLRVVKVTFFLLRGVKYIVKELDMPLNCSFPIYSYWYPYVFRQSPPKHMKQNCWICTQRTRQAPPPPINVGWMRTIIPNIQWNKQHWSGGRGLFHLLLAGIVWMPVQNESETTRGAQ